jgi:hypothetical protein
MDKFADILESIATLSLGCNKQLPLSKALTTVEQQPNQPRTTGTDQLSSIFGPDSIVYRGERTIFPHINIRYSYSPVFT